MLIIPAIDLKGGKVVRLVRGDFSQELVYGEDPVAVARRWVEAGAKRLHVVDLDGALTGTPRHRELVAKIVQAVAVPVQTGGGIRSLAAIEESLRLGVAQVILGTKACLDEAFVTRALKAFDERIAAAVDVKEGRVALEGWVRKEWMKPHPLVRRLIEQGVRSVITTDASRDGTMTGPAVDSLRDILAAAAGRASVFASGGVSSLEDLRQLRKLEPIGLSGVVVGRALYEGKLDLKAAIQACSQKESSPASTSKTAGSSKESASGG